MRIKGETGRLAFFSGMVIFVGIVVGILRWVKKEDVNVGLVTEAGIAAVSLSPRRQMVSIAKIDGEKLIWIPGGLGWYRADRILKVWRQEKMKKEKLGEVFFYNLGFISDSIVISDSFEGWENSLRTAGEMGWFNYLRMRAQINNLMANEEKIDGGPEEIETILDKVAARDWAKEDLLAGNERISVINTTVSDKLAEFVAKRLEWAGLMVVETRGGEKLAADRCVVRYFDGFEKKKLNLLNRYLMCTGEMDGSLNLGEVEIVLGEGYAKMIEYSSYNN